MNRANYYRNHEASKARAKEKNILHNYGVTIEQYDEMFARQGGVCAICERPEGRAAYRLSVDHDHVTGRVRGLLCLQCNIALGQFQDDPDRIAAAIKYLEESLC